MKINDFFSWCTKGLLILVSISCFNNICFADRIKDIADTAGQRSNQLVGYGLVVGLDGTGDQTTQTPFTLQSVLQMIGVLGVTLPSTGNQTQLRNTAAVMVTAEFPALSRPGQQIDVTVSSLGNSTSLKGGTLVMTPLKAADGQVYAQAQGNIVIGGSRAATGGAATSVNHLSAGRIPSGGIVERAVPALLVDEFVQLDLRQADFSLMQRTAETIGRRFGVGTALPIDARSLNVRVPTEPLKRTAFMAALQDLDVPMGSQPARVILNSRTGSVVMNQAVKLSPSAVAHGNLTIKIQQSPTVSQPLPFSRGQTTTATEDTATISDSGKENSLIAVPGGASLDQVVKALNMMGATPQDLISILQSLRAAGALRAELEVI
ncbi:flagellar basal body P-ring protein FlgI [Polynucleobacter sp. MG-6-Vaara-E2]|jgi:flagellar P-ring protein precursor FlgI|uniref:flagellar basal body P-ring protein FlgI n=1 Tax=Polynucleobacter sp. MG-6-Vaara-E2 TaxID=2576932 RepID=UPI001BFCF43C|nr:flagellar basal body P-ring protein FlgI [Polynucleobacter sp. MG-6-Vaara-E2]QWD96012.1 flagellar basal body P-ring protein FlgI [Polynucleobacter sp. MG-6-Vaara-E2]